MTYDPIYVHLRLTKEMAAQLDAYRQRRRQEAGKILFRDTAAAELLRKSLEGVVPETPVLDRLRDLEDRMSQLEVWQAIQKEMKVE